MTASPLIKIEFSSVLFNGFAVKLNPEMFASLQDVINYCSSCLIDVLSSNNLSALTNKAIETTFHFHDITMEDLRLGNRQCYYVCDHN